MANQLESSPAAALRSTMTVLQAAAARRRMWMPWRSGEGDQPRCREREYARHYLAEGHGPNPNPNPIPSPNPNPDQVRAQLFGWAKGQARAGAARSD
eukprot:scaffold37496_cov63-Phaeocystis_antarctica.AAC.3